MSDKKKPAYTMVDVERMRRLIWEQHVAKVLYGARSGNVVKKP